MRLLIISLLALIFSFTLNAQQGVTSNTNYVKQDVKEEIEMDNPFILGGSLNISYAKNTFGNIPLLFRSIGLPIVFTGDDEDLNTTSFSIHPYFGKELNPNWALGLQIGYDYTKQETVEDGETIAEADVNGFRIGGFGRYTFQPEQKLNFFLQPYFEYSSSNQTGMDFLTDIDGELSMVDIGVDGGFLYNFNDNLRATLRVGLLNYVNGNYTRETDDPGIDVDKDFSSFGLNLRMSTVFFGMELKL